MTASSQRPSSSQIDDETLLDMYERMILIRRFETEAACRSSQQGASGRFRAPIRMFRSS